MNFGSNLKRKRVEKGYTQEQFSELLGVSRQAVSKWELDEMLPDGENIVKIAKLFSVTTDYLLNDEYESDNDLPKVKQLNSDGIHQIMIFMVTLEVMILIIQFMTTIILQNVFFSHQIECLL